MKVDMDSLNYHHLRYFREVAREGNLTRAAQRANLSQSAMSAQIKLLEERLGHALFERVGRRLELTEVGRIALDHAERIFGAGEELLATLERANAAAPPLRVGARSTLSRNFQLRFLRPILRAQTLGVILRSGDAPTLLADLKALALDVVLTTEPPSGQAGVFVSHRIAEQPAALHGAPDRVAGSTLEELLAREPLILPTEPSIRAPFESVLARLGLAPRIAAEVDDMAMVRLLAREHIGLALAPSVVFADEIRAGLLSAAPFDLGVAETFFAVTVKRSYPHPQLERLLAAADTPSSPVSADAPEAPL